MRRRIPISTPCEDDILEEHTVALAMAAGVSLAELNLANAITEHMDLVAFRIACQGAEIKSHQLAAELSAIAEQHGIFGGIPMPAVEATGRPDLVLADGVGLSNLIQINQEQERYKRRLRQLERAAGDSEYALMLRLRNVPVRNSWSRLGDQTVCVVETTEGPMAFPQHHAGLRLQKLMRGIDVRLSSPLRADAELRAMDSLKQRITETQWNCYVLNGAFIEHSKRSDLFYLFRKGLPALVMSYHGAKAKNVGSCIAALCLHPMGYYSGTHVGVMTPTDEVIAQLLMMRSDEHRFWAKSGQWRVWDTRSGV